MASNDAAVEGSARALLPWTELVGMSDVLCNMTGRRTKYQDCLVKPATGDGSLVT